MSGYSDGDYVSDSGVVSCSTNAIVSDPGSMEELPMPMSVGAAGFRLRERSGENTRSEEQDSEFDDSRGKHFVEVVSCQNPT